MTDKSYRCYFTDAGDHIRSNEQIVCSDDAAAALRVEQLLLSSKHRSAELWLGKRLVGMFAVPLYGESNVSETISSQQHRPRSSSR